jgi:dihydrolipoamide dehydrogenase
MAERYEAAVIGGGPGGYVAAIRLGQLGKKTIVIEKGELGGVCLNWGCIPSKAVIHAAELRHEVQHASKAFGIGTGEVPVDLAKMRTWKQGIVKKLTGGIGQLLKANQVTHVRGTATLTGPKTLKIEGADGKTTEVEFRSCIVATGATPIELPFLPRSNKRVWTSQEMLELDILPPRLAIVGGGVIGMEMAAAYAKLGCQVTVIELTNGLLPGVDPELVKPVRRRLDEQGVKVLLEHKATGIEEKGDHAVLKIEPATAGKGEKLDLPIDRVLVSIGFRPNTKGIGLESTGVKLDPKGWIPIDAQCRTNVESIYAIGDVTGPPYLAHRASKQGIVCAEVIGGEHAACDFQAMPGGIFCDPEVATVGLNEEEAKKAGHDVQVGRFPFAALGRAMAQEATAGLVKVVTDKKTGVLLGVGITGARANDLIAEAALAIEMGAHVEDLALTIHTHPTFSEAMCEAAEDALGKAIHVASRRSPR